MVTPALERHFRERGVALIPLATGAKMFVDEVSALGGDVMTEAGAWIRLLIAFDLIFLAATHLAFGAIIEG